MKRHARVPKTMIALCGLLLLVAVRSAPAADTSTGAFLGMAETGPLDTPVRIGTYEEYVNVFGGDDHGLDLPYLAPSVAAYFANGGVELVVVRVAAADDATLIGSVGGAGQPATGLQTLRAEDDVSFVAIPGAGSPAVQAALIAHCEAMGDRMALLDSASPDDVAAVQAQRATLASDQGFAALYFPWVIASPTGVSRTLPPSGFAAALYSNHEPPDSPIGVLATATGVAYPVTNTEQDVLNPLGINCVRNLSGIRVWGARTLATNPDLVYIAVRRTKSYLTEAMNEATQWCVFEPNDATTWTGVEISAENLLYESYRNGWFAGATPSDAYFAQCGYGLTMTQADLDAGRLVLVFGFAVVAPAEFLLVRIEHQLVTGTPVPPAPDAPFAFSVAGPNPFNPMTRVALEIERDGPATVTIHDARGRRVRTLLDGALEAGRHTLAWDGRSDGGGELPSGLYLARARAAGDVQTLKLVLVR